jgi:Leucine-rich repeat (LRR) protein
MLDLSENQLTGSIPPHLCKHQKLRFLYLGSNHLVGDIPQGLKACKSPVQLLLRGNMLTGSLA